MIDSNIMGDISLQICDKTFQVKKEILCQYSDYFRAMFSGYYIEDQQKQISIDTLDPNTMSIVLQYMNTGLIDLSEYSLETISDITVVANFLQITELIKQIEYTLEMQLCESNWMETMALAETAAYFKLEQLSAAFGLYSFRTMKPKYIPTIHKLAWYLSHPYLDTHSELDVFNFGFKWILHNETGADALLIVLGCLDFKRITNHEIEEIKKCTSEYKNSLALKVADCLYELSNNKLEICEAVLNDKKSELCEKFTERVWKEIVNLTKESKSRLLSYTPVVPMWVTNGSKEELLPHFMYTYNNEKGFEQWLEVSEKNVFGWSVVSWGLTKLVIVGGQDHKTMSFMKDVKVYDTLKQEWTSHGVDLPPKKYAGLAVVGNSLYIVGGVGGRCVYVSALHITDVNTKEYVYCDIIYNLKQRTYRAIATFPDDIETPAVCSHKKKVYAAGIKGIFRYERLGASHYWRDIVDTRKRMTCIKSYKEFIYCINVFSRGLFRFRPDVDEHVYSITYFSSFAYSLCNIGNELIVFTNILLSYEEIEAFTLTVEQFTSILEKPVVLFETVNESLRLIVSGSCALAMTLPPLCMELSQYHHKYLSRYADPD